MRSRRILQGFRRNLLRGHRARRKEPAAAVDSTRHSLGWESAAEHGALRVVSHRWGQQEGASCSVGVRRVTSAVMSLAGGGQGGLREGAARAPEAL